MRVLVTGANGHIGTNLLPMLVEAGHDVVPFVRDAADTTGIDPLGLEYARGDVLDPEALRDAAADCDAIIHMAAVYTFSNDPEEVMAPAVEGAKNIMAAAKTHGITRLVYTSSTVAIGTSTEPRELGRSDWSDDTQLPYAIAKRDSERVIAKLADEAGIELIIINPTAVIGPGDYRITPSHAAIRDWIRGISQTVSGGMS